MEVLVLEEINKSCSDERILLTVHGKNRCVERGIKFEDIKNAILSGEIIKQYEDDKPFPSCLILGKSTSNKMIHVVLSMDEGYIYYNSLFP